MIIFKINRNFDNHYQTKNRYVMFYWLCFNNKYQRQQFVFLYCNVNELLNTRIVLNFNLYSHSKIILLNMQIFCRLTMEDHVLAYIIQLYTMIKKTSYPFSCPSNVLGVWLRNLIVQFQQKSYSSCFMFLLDFWWI